MYFTIEDLERASLVMRTSRSVKAGDTVIRVRSVPEGIVGEEIVIDVYGDNPETKTVTAQTTKYLTVSALGNDHEGDVAVLRKSFFDYITTLTLTGDLILDDNSGDSPQIKLVGEYNNDTALLYLIANVSVGTSDLALRLAGDVAGALLEILNKTGTVMFSFSAIGAAVFNEQGHIDADFRVEGNTETHGLFYDSELENVSVNSAPVSQHYDLLLGGDGVMCLKQTTTPTATADYGKVYCKSDDKLYFQDGAGAEHEIATV